MRSAQVGRQHHKPLPRILGQSRFLHRPVILPYHCKNLLAGKAGHEEYLAQLVYVLLGRGLGGEGVTVRGAPFQAWHDRVQQAESPQAAASVLPRGVSTDDPQGNVHIAVVPIPHW